MAEESYVVVVGDLKVEPEFEKLLIDTMARGGSPLWIKNPPKIIGVELARRFIDLTISNLEKTGKYAILLSHMTLNEAANLILTLGVCHASTRVKIMKVSDIIGGKDEEV
ncbi:MAG: hypothetical protein ACXABD_18775 [Candidatus Thorarchaeota archaeon]|jgi:hypothetical protein